MTSGVSQIVPELEMWDIFRNFAFNLVSEKGKGFY